MRRGTHTLVAREMFSKLMSRQQKLLDEWAATTEGYRALASGEADYDRLPETVKTALERIKNQETLQSDAERYMWDLRMKQR